MIRKTHMLQARTFGYRTYRVPGILCTGNDVLIATAEARRGRGGDWDVNDIVMRRSLNRGFTWEPVTVAVRSSDYGPGPVSNCSMFCDQSGGATHALFCHDYARIFHMRSDDDGARWSEPREITGMFEPLRKTYPWRVIAIGPGHGIQLANGRLFVPLWMSDGSGTEFGPGRLGHRPSAVAATYSDDHGQTWQVSDLIVCTDERYTNPSETVAAQLDDGRVLVNIRNEGTEQRRLVSISPNGESYWSTPEFIKDLLEPVCMGSLLKLRSGALLFANPDTLDRTSPPSGPSCGNRKNLTAKLSHDDGATWPISRVIEPGPSSYSDLAQTSDGRIHCIYEDGIIERANDTHHITVASFDEGWVLSDS